MNYFFLFENFDFTSKVQIPKFRNDGVICNGLELYALAPSEKTWKLKQVDCEENSSFFYLNSDKQSAGNLYFVAKHSDLSHLRDHNLASLQHVSDFTSTDPAYRCSFSVSKKCNDNQISTSYQAEYPFQMTQRKGSVVSAVAMLSNRKGVANYLVFPSFFKEPCQQTFVVYFISKKRRVILGTHTFQTNTVNMVPLDNTLLQDDVYFVSTEYLGVPIYLSIGHDGSLSMEHTHPPHENVPGPDRFLYVKEMKREFLEIIS